MYNIKLIKNKTERMVERDEYRATESSDCVFIQLIEKGSVVETVSVPIDYDVVYVMNLQGKTLRVFSWPPKESRTKHRFDYSSDTGRLDNNTDISRLGTGTGA